MANLVFSEVVFAYPDRGLLRRSVTPVFQGFSWRLGPGRTVVLGPNGAGKSTLLALGASALMPNRGRVTLDDHDVQTRGGRAAIRRTVAWMPQQTRAIPGLSAREQVAYAGWLRGMPRSAAWEAAAESLDRVGLSTEANRLTAQLSGGQQRRVGLAQCLVHGADVWLLDEPSAGLDPGQRARFREILVEVSQSATVLVSTHLVDDIADLYDSVVVLARGEIRFEGTADDFAALAPSPGPLAGEAAYATLVEAER